ncbi:uncharacterized protein LOC128566915 [Nycticebus coucang]|uniref:uncharacterized protein LOC128566915 n=1 Tax=Nycticebus coucang TaxID=9470 RepID=UPI00234D7F9D|nr:uncharacterized protein LOC128566915 [Nycticebus coucang]
MLARLVLSPSRRASRLGIPELSGRGQRSLGAARQARHPLRSLLGSLCSRQSLETNFAQVSCAGAAAPLWALWPGSVRPRARLARGPLSSVLRPEPSRRWGRGAAGGDLSKTRHHLGSQVRAGAAPTVPTAAGQRAPSQPRPLRRRSGSGGGPRHPLRFRRVESPKRAAESAHCLALATPGVIPATLAGPEQLHRWRRWEPLPGRRGHAQGRQPFELRRKRVKPRETGRIILENV